MPHSFDAYGTPLASSAGPRDHMPSDDRREVGLFHVSRMPSISCEEERGFRPGHVVEHHIPRGDGRDDCRLYVGGSMVMSPERPPSPPLLKGGRRSKSSLSLDADDAPLSARRRSFSGGSMAFETTAAETASDARASEEAKLWRAQLLTAQQAPAAGAPSVRTATQQACNGIGIGLPNGRS